MKARDREPSSYQRWPVRRERHGRDTTEFQATCLDLLDRVEAREASHVEVTKRGQVVAVVITLHASATTAEGLHGFLRGTVQVLSGIELTAPVLAEAFVAKSGTLHE